MSKEAMKLALEALEKLDKVMKRSPDTDKAITAIKQALEQPAPYRAVKTYHDGKPVYVQEPPKREWQGLTDEDKQIAFDDTQEGGGFWEFADAIEATLRKKNHG